MKNWTIGDRFDLLLLRPWSGRGRRGCEKLWVRCEVTKLAAGQMDYRVVETLRIEDARPDGSAPVTTGGMTLDYAALLHADGDLIRGER